MEVRALYKKWNHFYNEHPYWSVLIIAIVSGVIGISIEFIVNGDFMKTAIYGILFYNILMLLSARRRAKKNKE